VIRNYNEKKRLEARALVKRKKEDTARARKRRRVEKCDKPK